MYNHKYYKNDKYNILTCEGYSHFDGIRINILEKGSIMLKITLENENNSIVVTPNHEFYYKDNFKKPICDFNIGDTLYTKNSKYIKIKYIETLTLEEDIEIYDIVNVNNKDNSYILTEEGIKVSNCLYIDEAAFIRDFDTFYASSYPVVSSGKTSKIIITSTPNGKNFFYKLWHEALEGVNTFIPYKVHWSEHPDRDQEWYEEQLRNIGEQRFDVEYNCEFAGSDGTLINGKKLASMTFKNPIEELDEGKILVYSYPQKNHSYVISVDVSEGVGGDYSVINIFDVTEMPYKQVFVYRSNTIVPNMLAILVKQFGDKYNEALVLVENNTYGGIVLEVLWNDLSYENIMTSVIKDGLNTAGYGGKTTQMGVRTTKKTKQVGCSFLKDLIETDQIEIVDYNTLNELTTFIKKYNSYQAKEGAYDDIAMTLVIFSWLTSQPYFHDIIGINSNENLRNVLSGENEEFVFGHVVDGIHENIGEGIDINIGW